MSSPGGSAPPTQLDCEYDDFELLDRLGSGGNADVHRARLTGEGRTVALKVPRLSEYGTLDSSFFEEFVEEAEIWARIDDHDHIVTVLDWGTTPHPWIALEHMEAGNLSTRLSSLEREERVRVFEEVCDAVFHAHRHGVTHGDIKPENVLFTERPGELVAKVGDWGLANVLLEHSQSTEGMTLGYSAPEQLDSGEFGSTDDRSDIYQLGALGYELFTGSTPFETDRTAELVNDILHGNPTPPSERVPALPPELDDVLLTALAKDKDERHETVPHLRDGVLDAFESGSTSVARSESRRSRSVDSVDRDACENDASEREDDLSEHGERTSEGETTPGADRDRGGQRSSDDGVAESDEREQAEDGGLWGRFHRPVSELDLGSRGVLGDVGLAFQYPRTMSRSTMKYGALTGILSLIYGLGLPLLLGYQFEVIRRTASAREGMPEFEGWKRLYKHGLLFLGFLVATFVAVVVPAGVSPSEGSPLTTLSVFGFLLWLYLLPLFVVTYGTTRGLRSLLRPQNLRAAFSLRYLGTLAGAAIVATLGYFLVALSLVTIVGVVFAGFFVVTALAAFLGRRYHAYEFT